MTLQKCLQGGATLDIQGDLQNRATINVGDRLRKIRHLRRLSLKQVAERSGLSESFLSQVERGQARTSIASLQKIAAVLGTNMAGLFEQGNSKPQVLRKGARQFLEFGNLGRKCLITPKPLENLEIFAGELSPNGSTGDEPYSHGDSEEFFIVVAGAVHLQLGADIYEMATGDSIVYRSSMPHRVVNIGREIAQVLWVISPPSY